MTLAITASASIIFNNLAQQPHEKVEKVLKLS
jgi:hypothetical protein